jgi:hypothetical protein
MRVVFSPVIKISNTAPTLVADDIHVDVLRETCRLRLHLTIDTMMALQSPRA